MSTIEMIAACHQYKELQRMQEEITAEMAAIADSIKSALGDLEMITAGEYKISYKTVNGFRLDSSSLKKELPEIAARYTVPTVQKRFQIR